MLRIIRMADSISLIPCQVNHSSFISWCMYFQRDLYGSDTTGSFHAGSKMKRWLFAEIFLVVRNISHSSVTNLQPRRLWYFMVMTSPDVLSAKDPWWLVRFPGYICCADDRQLNTFQIAFFGRFFPHGFKSNNCRYCSMKSSSYKNICGDHECLNPHRKWRDLVQLDKKRREDRTKR